MTNTPILPLKDALRGLRFGLQSGRETLRPLQQDLPAPLRDIVQKLDGAMESVTIDIDKATSKLAHRILDLGGGSRLEMQSLPVLMKHDTGDVLFAQLAYRGLTRAFADFECDKPLVSELLAARAFEDAKKRAGIDPDPLEMATDLAVTMRSQSVVRFTHSASDKSTIQIPVALMAMILWFLAERSVGEDEDALLDVCCEVAHALSDQIGEIDGDRAETRVFLDQYAGCI